ncbi:transporter substrate-binding domain-containing protein [Microbulbifer agarilyticus]|nr:transporter substrate-binding domain-containing protein [Microbulbifer agarilyticus]
MPKDAAPELESQEIVATTSSYTETGDLDAIRKRGYVRFANVTGGYPEMLPRDSIINQRTRFLANEFAKRLGVKPMWIIARSPQAAIDMIETGEADIVADYITLSLAQGDAVTLSVPLTQTYRALLSTADGPNVSDISKLKGATIYLWEGTAHLQFGKQLVKDYPEAFARIQIDPTPGDDTDHFLDQMARYPNAVTIGSLALANEVASYRSDLKIGQKVGDEINVSWAVREASPDLLNRLNTFLTRQLIQDTADRAPDWRAIKKSGVIRFATYNKATSYFIWRGVLMGFDYELAKLFADEHNLQLNVIVVPTHESLTKWVTEGRADFAGASTTITDKRKAEGVDFTNTHFESGIRVISNENDSPIENLEDLNGRTLTVRAHSIYIDAAKQLREGGIDVKVEEAPEDVSQAQIINGVAEGKYDATLEDTHRVEMRAAFNPNLRVGIQVEEPLPQGWMVIRGNRSLLRRLNRFVKKYRKDPETEAIFTRYFRPNDAFLKRATAKIKPGEPLSPFDELIKDAAQRHDFDWRMIVAQMWTESSFDPKAVSSTGAQGLLQVMPGTARDMGFPPPVFDPERGIDAGVKYLNWVRDRFEENLPATERLWFTLASYNAGFGHVRDARRLAAKLGLDPNKWFDNVEVAIRKLSEPRYFEKARYGFVHGDEPIAYVRKISHLYQSYTQITSGDVSWRPPMKTPHQWFISLFKQSVQSCRYGCSTPSTDAPPRRQPVGSERQSAGEFYPPQPTARPVHAGHSQSQLSPLVTGAAR